MFVKWLRENVWSSWLMLVLRLYLGYDWLTAGWDKITGDFDATGFLKGAVAKAASDNPTVTSWWASFLEGFAIPNVGLFNFLVSWGEFLVGLGLILGVFTTFSALMGAVMYFSFMFSGTLGRGNHIPPLLIITFLILVAGSNAGRFGLDPYIKPYWDKIFTKSKKKDENVTV
ncbi:Crp/Fnr family transcriptional regulator [Vulcanibacillus modesticaldus]|uniref:Crp/Fnr family transcriptional regulator n=1 Tax=Vulcanibacillus modesticaldus TaxID=337097 RepID=A0A1D2YSW8_9BACI|nr:DoxX family protein [Vulcanibacillus modesticaldus]OEF98093.1 Crp/Fnr family transcriptional regulator [Vulcanibacillus modesticaldus]